MGDQSLVRQFCALSVQKRGNGADEYEDAWASNPILGRFAIADGATESSYADCWARLLVDGFVASSAPIQDSWSSWLPPLQKQWVDFVDAKDLPYFAKNKVQRGAFATFLGVALQKSGWFRHKIHWSAVAVGDACLFLIRQGKFDQSFPITKADEFNSSPYLIGSRLTKTSALAEKEVRRYGTCFPGDCFWLMTDALSHWFLAQSEANKRPWEQLAPFLLDDAARANFPLWVEELRNNQELRNDDVTLVGLAL